MKKAAIALSMIAFLAFSCGETKTNEETVPSENSSTESNTDNSKPTEAMSGPPKVFYYDYDQQRGTEDGIEMSKEDAIKELENLPEVDGNFFGLELADGKIVQFMYDGNKSTWFLDIPNPVTQESYNADLTREQAVKIIGDVYGGKSADDIQAAYK